MYFWIVRNGLFFMGIIFCSSVVLVWTFNARAVHNFITKKANISVNLVSFFNDVSFLFCCFLKGGVTNELKSLFLFKSKKSRVIYSKQDKTLLTRKNTSLVSTCMEDRYSYIFFFKKSNIWPAVILIIFETNSSFHVKQRTTGKFSFCFSECFYYYLQNFYFGRRTEH